METKKNREANLERKKGTFLLLGITIALAFALISFEWTAAPAGNTIAISGPGIEIDQIDIPQTIEKKIEPPKVVSPELIKIIENTIDVPTEKIIIDDPGGIDKPLVGYILNIPEDTITATEEFRIVEEMPQFRGGDISRFSQWVNERIRYPRLAQENGIQGMVIVDFAVGPDGKITDIKIVRSVEKSIDDEVLRVVSESPKWTPGKQRGVPVKVRFTIPIHFRLN